MANHKLAAPLIEMGEGGLSRATTDKASSFPAPWPYNGVYGWHTNRGITYAAFKSASGKLGFADSAENFFGMPDEIWNKIFKNIYWDAINADNINSDAIAIYACSWLWGSGVNGGQTRLTNFIKSKYGISISKSQIKDTLNRLTKEVGELQLLEDMLESREAQFRAMNQPANLTGWLKRLERYRTNLTAIIKKKSP